MPMKSSIVALLLALAVVSPSMAADLKEEIVAIEKASWKALADHDAKAYGDTMTDDAIEVTAQGEVVMGRQKIMADIGSSPCNVKSFDLADTKLRQLSPDIAILTYNLTQDVTCDGKKLPRRYSPHQFTSGREVSGAGPATRRLL